MVTLASSRLIAVAARSTWKLPAVQDFGARRLRSEPSMQTPLMKLSLLPIGDKTLFNGAVGRPDLGLHQTTRPRPFLTRPGCRADGFVQPHPPPDQGGVRTVRLGSAGTEMRIDAIEQDILFERRHYATGRESLPISTARMPQPRFP
jgi:hypothetical protein